MDQAKIIGGLCSIIEQQNEIIEAQAMELAQLDAVAREDEIARLREQYKEIMGETGGTTV